MTSGGVAMPVVSPRLTPARPICCRRRATSPTRAAGTSPSNGQPNEVEIAPCTGIPASSATLATSSNPASDSSIPRFTFFRLWLSDADTNTTISSTSASAARSAPRLFGTRAASTAPPGPVHAAHDLLGVGELRHRAGRDEGGRFDAGHAGIDEPVDELDLLRGGDEGLVRPGSRRAARPR